jgi:hypothetical protein
MKCRICGADHTACVGSGYVKPKNIIDLRKKSMRPVYMANERLYLNGNGEVVKEGDPSRITLLVAKGGQLAAEVAERYGLLEENNAPEELSSGAERSFVDKHNPGNEALNKGVSTPESAKVVKGPKNRK